MKPNTFFYLKSLLERERKQDHEKFVEATYLLGVQELNQYGEIKLKKHRPEDQRANETIYNNYRLKVAQMSDMISELSELFERQ